VAQGFDEQIVRHVAHLARLKLSDEQLAQYGAQLSRIVDYVELLEEVDTSDVPPTAHPLDITNVMREDTIDEPLPTDRALLNAPDHDDTYFRVPKVLDQDGA